MQKQKTKSMRHKTLFYNVEPIANLLPDDCLKIIISYAYDESRTEYLEYNLYFGEPTGIDRRTPYTKYCYEQDFIVIEQYRSDGTVITWKFTQKYKMKVLSISNYKNCMYYTFSDLYANSVATWHFDDCNTLHVCTIHGDTVQFPLYH